jgi:hypothetical protein
VRTFGVSGSSADGVDGRAIGAYINTPLGIWTDTANKIVYFSESASHAVHH